YCGTCTRCLDACPTSAFIGPYELDSRRCLSYWTIEHKGPIADEFADRLGDWVFGCDVCQDGCPWNRTAAAGRDPDLSPRSEWPAPDVTAGLKGDPDEFGRSIRGTGLARAKRSGLLRGAALIRGAGRAPAAVPVLIERLEDPDPLVRESVA